MVVSLFFCTFALTLAGKVKPRFAPDARTMKKQICVLLCLSLVCAGASAAQKKKTVQHKKISKTYVNTPVVEALQDIAKHGTYQLDFTEADLDEGAVVNAKFKNVSAPSAIKKILGKQYVVKAKKGVIRITNVPVPPTLIEVKAKSPSSVQEDEEKIVYTYQDTTFAVACRTVTHQIEQEKATDTVMPAKHYVQAFANLGYSSLGYNLGDAGKNRGGFGAGITVQYAYYFHPNWGFHIGVGLDEYSSNGVLNNKNVFAGVGDSDGERYDHYALTHNWKEHQITHIVNLPIGFQCQYPVNENNLKVYAGAGVRVGVPVYNKYSLRSGAVEHQGYYEQWNMLIQEGTGNMGSDRDFYTETIGTDFSKERKDLKLNKVSLAVDVQVGLMVPMSQVLDLMVGLYAQIGCLDLTKGNDKIDLGFQQPEQTGYRRHDFMNAYPENGLLGTSLSSAVRPYSVGLTVGISWHHIEKPKPAEPIFEHLQVCDTTFTTKARVETTMKPKKEVVRQMVQVLHKSVIWFEVNSTVPKLEPADVLDKLAAILVAYPTEKVVISGHASKEGNAQKNKVLSQKRAQAVADLLMQKGVKADQLLVEAHAADIDYQAENTPHTLALDRRVEIIPLENGQRVGEVKLIK